MWSLMTSNNFTEIFIGILVALIIIFLEMPLTDFSRAFMAYKLGDPTAKNMGRLTLNPLAHLDLFGSISMFILGIGWTKHMPINHLNFKKPKRDTIFVALAAPVANFLAAFLGSILLSLTFMFSGGSGMFQWVYIFFLYYIDINIFLMLVYLIPFPGLNGEPILEVILTPNALSKFYRFYSKISVYGSTIVIILLFIIMRAPLNFLSNLISNFLISTSGIIFGV